MTRLLAALGLTTPPRHRRTWPTPASQLRNGDHLTQGRVTAVQAHRGRVLVILHGGRRLRLRPDATVRLVSPF